MGFVLYLVLTLVGHWGMNYNTTARPHGRAVVRPCSCAVVGSCSRNFVPPLILDSSEPRALASSPVAGAAQLHNRAESGSLIDSGRAT